MNANFYLDNADESTVRESCDVLISEIQSIIEEPTELFSPTPVSNVLEILNTKLHAYSIVTGEDTDAPQLLSIEEEVNDVISTESSTEFPFLTDLLETTGIRHSFTNKFILTTLFNYLYLRRKEMLMCYLLEYVITSRASFCKRYKTVDSKKDMTYQAIRQDIKIRNPDYYIIIMHSNEICTDVLGDETLDFLEVVQHIEPDESELVFFQDLLGGSTYGTQVMSSISISLLESQYLSSFKSEFKLRLTNAIKQMI